MTVGPVIEAWRASTGDEDVNPGLIPPVLFLLAALGVSQLVINIRRLLTWPAATGTVVDHTYNPSNDDTKAPVVMFQTREGHTMHGTDRLATSWNRYKPGRQVPVRYDVRNPQKVVIGYHMTVVWVVWIAWMAIALWAVLSFSD